MAPLALPAMVVGENRFTSGRRLAELGHELVRESAADTVGDATQTFQITVTK